MTLPGDEMPTELWLAYCAYLVWLVAGLGDFIRHWHTDLPHTSGTAESAAHLVQLGLLGVAIVLGLAFEMGPAIALAMLGLVVAHAAVGYLDTRIAFSRRRVVSPAEQHIHSVLDMAPIVGLAWLLASTWPAAVAAGWPLQLRQPVLPVSLWLAVLVPATVLCVVPALLEFRAAWRAQHQA